MFTTSSSFSSSSSQIRFIMKHLQPLLPWDTIFLGENTENQRYSSTYINGHIVGRVQMGSRGGACVPGESTVSQLNYEADMNQRRSKPVGLDSFYTTVVRDTETCALGFIICTLVKLEQYSLLGSKRKKNPAA